MYVVAAIDMKNKNMLQCLQKKLSMTLELDGVPRYIIKKVSRYRYSVPSTDDTGNGNKGTVPRYFSTRYCSPLLVGSKGKL